MINQTSVPAELMVTEGENGMRAGVVVAKATFLIGSGSIELDTEGPLPVLTEDVPTELGVLPQDTLVPGPRAPFEVALLAAAYPSGELGEEMTVHLTIADRELALGVSGDRFWRETEAGPVASAPAPFTRLPLTWSRTFGGRADVWVDPHTCVWVEDPLNPEGRGFDAFEAARGLAGSWGAPQGFPRVGEGERALPNLERPTDRASSWGARPEPYCWAPLSISNRLVPRWQSERTLNGQEGSSLLHSLQRCHPDLCFPSAPVGAPVRLRGCHPDGDLEFRIPALRVGLDYELGARSGYRDASPQLLIIMADERRFTMTYRLYFQFPHEPDEVRSVRLVVGEG